MKTFILLLLITSHAFAQESLYEEAPEQSAKGLPIIIQVKYSPWGGIDADEDEFDNRESSENSYEKYDMTFERSYSARLIIEPFYISAQRSTTKPESDIPDAEVTTFAAGFAGISFDPFESRFGHYLMGGLGIGQGTFEFKDPEQNDHELLLEANGEIGFHINQRLLLGLGVDYQHFGEFQESIASSWTFYFTTGLVF